ncbi:hypothetical protein BV898_02807 [Hypsibius exemplaris]|uniref:Uncharacterized protein n=1 Tax=Hypsibius exemplaris TaxID=2072580 RepID=A0A1W0X7X2_HYPEX|nr:hypothetical protein BV898_02807 [Hypsibius exemplaris]
MKQRSLESLLNLANRIRDATVACKFPSDTLDNSLHTAFVMETESESPRRRLMSQDITSLEQAPEIARRFEIGQAGAAGTSRTPQ